MPVLSIITINFNNKAGLQKTIFSVSSQTNRDFELIIIDGGSKDGSVDVINQNKTIINHFVSEMDNGIYDAQNKGIKNANGEYLLFLNSGDTFFNNTVIQDFYNFVLNKNFGIVYGNTNILFSNKPNQLLIPSAKLDTNFFFKHTINHQACFIHKKLFVKYGYYNTSYKICADFDFFFNVFMNEPNSYSYFDCIVCNYEDGGLSSTLENYDLVVSEKQKILKSYLTHSDYKMFYTIYLKNIPLKYRILDRVYKIPVLNWLFKKIYGLLKANA